MALILRRKLVAPPAKIEVDFKTESDRNQPVPMRLVDQIRTSYRHEHVCRFADIAEGELFIRPVIGSSIGGGRTNAVWTRTGATTARIVVIDPRARGPVIVGVQDDIVPVLVDEDVRTGTITAVGFPAVQEHDRRRVYEIVPYSEIPVRSRFWPANGQPIVDIEVFRKLDAERSEHRGRDGQVWVSLFNDDAPCYDLSGLDSFSR